MIEKHRRVRLTRHRAAIAAAAQCVGRRGHRLDADDVVVVRREHLRGGIALLELHLDPPVAAREREHGAVGHLVESVVVLDGLQRLRLARPLLCAPVGMPQLSTGRWRIVGVVSCHSSRGTSGICRYGW